MCGQRVQRNRENAVLHYTHSLVTEMQATITSCTFKCSFKCLMTCRLTDENTTYNKSFIRVLSMLPDFVSQLKIVKPFLKLNIYSWFHLLFCLLFFLSIIMCLWPKVRRLAINLPLTKINRKVWVYKT